MGKNHQKIILAVVGIIIVAIAARYSYYGSLVRSCIYTEEEKTISPRFRQAKIRLFKQAVVISGPTQEYACLPLMNQFTNRIQEVQYAQHETGDKTLIDEKSNLEFSIIKYVSVTKHGFTTIDSGKGPIDYLILQDQLGKFYRVAVVNLGINRDSDEFMKATTSEGEEVLSPETAFLE